MLRHRTVNPSTANTVSKRGPKIEKNVKIQARTECRMPTSKIASKLMHGVWFFDGNLKSNLKALLELLGYVFGDQCKVKMCRSLKIIAYSLLKWSYNPIFAEVMLISVFRLVSHILEQFFGSSVFFIIITKSSPNCVFWLKMDRPHFNTCLKMLVQGWWH